MYIRDVDIGVDIDVSPLAREINVASYGVEGLYLECLGRNKLFTGQYWKAIVRLYKNLKEPNKLDSMVDVIAIHKSFDFETYFSKTAQEKKKILLDTMHEGLMDIARQKGWDINPLLDAYNCCLAKNIYNEGLLKKKYFRSPDKQHYAGVHFTIDYDYATVSIVFLDKKKKEISRKKITKIEPFYLSDIEIVGWKDSNTFFVNLITEYYPEKKIKEMQASLN